MGAGWRSPRVTGVLVDGDSGAGRMRGEDAGRGRVLSCEPGGPQAGSAGGRGQPCPRRASQAAPAPEGRPGLRRAFGAAVTVLQCPRPGGRGEAPKSKAQTQGPGGGGPPALSVPGASISRAPGSIL